MGQLWYETWFAAIDNQAGRDNRRIGFYLEKPDAGASDAAGGTGAHPSNARFYVDINGGYLSGSLNTTGDITGSALQLGNLGAANEILIVGANTQVTSSDLLSIDTANQRLGIGTSTPEVKLDIVGESSGEAQVRVAQHDNTNDGPDIRFFKSHGTAASPTAIANGDYIGAVNAFAYNGSSYLQSGFFGFQADGIDGDTTFGLRTRVDGTLADRIAINAVGDVNIAENLTVTGDITGSDITIDDWGSVSASLASLDASIYGDSDVTDHINSLDVHSGSHLGTADTDDLSEGSTNLYYTDTRVNTKLNTEGVISGSSQVDINSTSGTLTTLGTVTSGDVSAILPSGVISGSISSPSQGTITLNGNNIDLGVQVGDSPTFTDLTLTGNLTVEGTRTELQVTELNVEDKNITVASGAADSAAADGAGLTIAGANESLTWNHANSRFEFSDDLRVDGLLNIDSVSNAGTDTDKFLVLDSNGNVDYRTGNEVRSDIGAAGTANLSGAPSELAFFGSSTEVTSSIRTKITENIATGNVLIHHGQLNVINDPTNTGNSAMQIIVGSGSSNDVANPQYDSFLSMEHEGGNGTQVALRANGIAPTSAQIKMRTDVNDAYSIGRLTNPYGANTLRIKPTVIAEGGLSITGSLTISGSNTLRNIGPAEFSGSVNIRTSDQVAATTDTNKFMVLDGQQIKYRTGTEVYDDIGVTSLSSSIAADIAGISGGVITPIQLTVDCKNLASGHVPWSALSDLQPNANRAYTTWIAPTSGYLEKVIVSPEQTNTTAATARLQFIENGTTTETISVTMGAAGTNKTFTFTPATTAFSAGDRLSLNWDKISNTSDLYNMMVVFRLSN
jgi:hypothetical protein